MIESIWAVFTEVCCLEHHQDFSGPPAAADHFPDPASWKRPVKMPDPLFLRRPHCFGFGPAFPDYKMNMSWGNFHSWFIFLLIWGNKSIRAPNSEFRDFTPRPLLLKEIILQPCKPKSLPFLVYCRGAPYGTIIST
ncbi:MAG: hypothetical protein CM1200mP30_33230 [Pseudomonadota bacterium]|nr:MAG: hypothetical protein CM1200mP30_33230 [Pseudomonadota bacterium]